MWFWVSIAAAAGSLGLWVWMAARPMAGRGGRGGGLVGGGPWRLVWPWVRWLAPRCAPHLPWPTRRRLAVQLAVAGLEGNWRPEHLVALQLSCAAAACLAVAAGVQLSGGTARDGWLALPLAGLAAAWPRVWLRRLGRERQSQMRRELPFLLDLMTLCVEAGLNLQGALAQAAQHGPAGPLRDELRHALSRMRAGQGRAQALTLMATRTGLPAVLALADSLRQAERFGMSLAPLLRAQSARRRDERFQAAEKRAMEAPVKMLGPLVLCIFPCTFAVLGFPLAVNLMQAF